MGDRTGIEWTEATWNPVTGCTKVSPGCDNCYAETLAERFRGTPGHYYEQGFDVVLRPGKLDQPLRWTRPRMIFVNSMSDLFHDEIPDEYIAKVFAVMAGAQQHTFQLLTKRHGRMRSLLSNRLFWQYEFAAACADLGVNYTTARFGYEGDPDIAVLPNLWLGVSAEDQKRAELRIPALLDTPAAVRWISAEPLLGPINLHPYWLHGEPGWGPEHPEPSSPAGVLVQDAVVGPRLDWVVTGGESGRGARPLHPDWVRTIRDQCAAADVAFLHKQWGEFLPTPVVEDQEFASGRKFQTPGGGWSAAVLREPSTHAFRSGETVPMRAGDENGHGVMLGDNTIALRVGKKKAGRELDGMTHDGYPAVATREKENA